MSRENLSTEWSQYSMDSTVIPNVVIMIITKMAKIGASSALTTTVEYCVLLISHQDIFRATSIRCQFVVWHSPSILCIVPSRLVIVWSRQMEHVLSAWHCAMVPHTDADNHCGREKKSCLTLFRRGTDLRGTESAIGCHSYNLASNISVSGSI